VRIVHLAERLSDRGGAYTHLLAVLAALARDHEQLLAVGADDGSARAPCRVGVEPGLGARTAAAVDLDGLVGRFRPDLVHVWNVVNPWVLHWAAARPRTLLTVQDHRAFCPTRGKWTSSGAVCRDVLDRELCRGCFDDAAYFEHIYALTDDRLRAVRRLPVVVLSRYMKHELVAAGADPERVFVIPPFVHGLERVRARDASGPGTASPGAEAPCVLFAGRLVEAKGVLDAVRAWKDSGLDLPLVVAGTGPLREQVAASGAEVLGWVPRVELAALFERARALLLPSRWQEPFGLVGLEALAFGVPVVAWQGGGIAEWHPGGGSLVAWGDAEGLARALRTAVVGRAVPPCGFEPESLMAELLGVYARVTGPCAARLSPVLNALN
jgi:glycosyltransferase involved in cell wall biosynthesis